MEYVGYLAILGILGFVGWLIWLGYATTEVKEEIEEVKTKLLLTESEVKKLTKPKLLELATELGVEVEAKSTKAVIVAEIEKVRK